MAEQLVPRWAPAIRVADGVAPSEKLQAFLNRAPAKYLAPAIGFGAPEPLLVAGGSFAVVSAAAGLDHGSIHTHGRFQWDAAFHGIVRSIGHGAVDPALIVAANTAHPNYFHWTVQSLAPILMAGPAAPLILPPTPEPWRQDSLALVAAGAVTAVAADTLGVFATAVRTNLTGGDFAFAPHPAVLAAFERLGARPPAGHGPRRVYLSRLDATDRRPMLNEAALADRLAARGFDIIACAALPLADQIALIRGAELVVAPHGAALTNLVYAADGAAGPQVIELLQENYLNRCFLKIAQGKGLRYAATVNPCVAPAHHHHLSTWNADLDLVERLLDAVG